MSSVLFVDVSGVLLERTDSGWAVRPGARALLEAARGRVGALLRPGGPSRQELLRQLELLGLAGLVDESLVLDSASLPVPLPDPRVFELAAVLAEVQIEHCVFVSAEPVLLVSAAMAGMKTVPIPEAPGAPSGLQGLVPELAVRAAPGARRAVGPSYVLEGRVVTLNSRSEVLERGRVLIRGGRIVAVEPAEGELPEEFRNAPRLDTHGTLYPGLIDLHNHFVYNVLPLWPVPKLYRNRTQWPRHPEYGSQISLPVRLLADHSLSARAVVRYVEAKALLAGTTTGQGIRTRVSGGSSLFRGAMRNAEEPGDDRLPEASTRVPDLGKGAENIDAFRRGLASHAAYFYHLGEGVDDYARTRYFDLLDNELIQPSLVGIHCLGLQREDFDTLAARGAKVVWSPFSNLLLYGKTLRLAELLASGVEFSLGCDWSPTGSKNLLEELKVARHEADRQGVALSSKALVRAVTSNAARVVGWSTQVGVLRSGALADLLVVAGTGGDPYDTLISATEKQVRLVIVDGVARYGDRELMEQLAFDPEHASEDWTVDGTGKAFHLWAEGSPLNDLSFARAQALLEEALSDLPGFRTRMEAEERRLRAYGIVETKPFVLELDNEPEEVLAEGFEVSRYLVDFDRVAERVELDPPTVGGESYWERLARQTNLDEALKQALRNDYTSE